jgi:N-acetyl-anhydromuramyl-L-alanine amidase AmpD
MSTDYPGASAHFLPTSYSFSNNSHKAIVIHKTASGGPGGLQSVYNTFLATERSTHYGIDLDGSVWQFVPEARGAGGNCCLEPGYNSFWSQYATLSNGVTTPNLNTLTFSIEHVDPTTDNSNPMPQAQVDASHKLVAYLCKKYGIGIDHIHSHASIDPINKARCPGSTYDFNALFNYIKGGQPMAINPFERAAFEQEWKSIVPTANVNSGIANAAWEDYQLGHFHGPPLKAEEDGKDWNGNPIKVQRLAGGRYEWDGHAHFYPY